MYQVHGIIKKNISDIQTYIQENKTLLYNISYYGKVRNSNNNHHHQNSNNRSLWTIVSYHPITISGRVTRRGLVGKCSCKVGACIICGSSCKCCKCTCNGVKSIDALARYSEEAQSESRSKKKDQTNTTNAQ